MALAEDIAERIHRFHYEDLPDAAVSWAKTAILDTIAVTLAGAVEDAPRILLKVDSIANARGPSLIFGTDRRTSVLDAALINGVASHVLDYDDVCMALGGHPSVPLVAPLIALGEALGSSGSDLLVAYVIGFETECRIGRGVHHYHYDKGWHPTSTLGIFGAAAGAARLLGISAQQTAVALGLAASFASGVKANFGTMTKSMHVGHCARSGLLAALMVQKGFTANPRALDAGQGFLEVFNGPGMYDSGRILLDWGAPFEVTGSEPGLKAYPCCGSTHSSIDMTLALRSRHQLTADMVARIEVMPHRRRLPHTNNPDPQTALEAKFSIQYVVARALVDGAVRLEHFEGDAHLDPKVRRLLPLVEVRAHPDMADDMANQFGAEVVVTTRDGRRLAARLDDYQRRGPGGNPMSPDDLWKKFEDCATRTMAAAQVAPLFAALESLDLIENVNALTVLLEHRGPTVSAGSRHAAETE